MNPSDWTAADGGSHLSVDEGDELSVHPAVGFSGSPPASFIRPSAADSSWQLVSRHRRGTEQAAAEQAAAEPSDSPECCSKLQRVLETPLTGGGDFPPQQSCSG